MMMSQKVELDYFHQVARQIRTSLPTKLARWGLTPKFNRWHLTKDLDSGMVVLFAVMNVRDISPRTSFFASQLLSDLTNDFRMQVAPCTNDGPSQAFILDRGHVDTSPAPIDLSFLDGDGLCLRAVNGERPIADMMVPQIPLYPHSAKDMLGDQLLVNQGKC
jgi:hypothetical protein